jgi:hypothetical protein
VGPPNARRGYISDVGATSAAMHWGFAAGGTPPEVDEWIAVLNEADREVTVSITTSDATSLLSLPGLGQIRVPRGARRVFRLNDYAAKAELPLVINATGPVVVERTTYRTSGTGASATMGAVLSTDHG